MCQEIIALAICAPTKAPHMSFTCGKLHMVAGKRIVCDKARGTCTCFFGTCGSVDREMTTATTDFTDLAKVRCAACTKREDDTGDRRHGVELIDSPLLQRPAIQGGEDVHREHQAALKNLWGGKPTCPFHAAPEIAPASIKDENATTSDNGSEKHSTASNEIEATTITDSAPSKATSAQAVLKNGLSTGVGLQSSRWANAPPAPAPNPMARPFRPRPSPTPTSPAPAARPQVTGVPNARFQTARAPTNKGFDVKARLATRQIFNAKSFLNNV